MTHTIGRIVPVTAGGQVTAGSPLSFTPHDAVAGGPPRFVMLHFRDVSLASGSKLTVQLGYGVDEFTSDSPSHVWTRPIDPKLGPIVAEVVGSGSARLDEYGSGEPTGSGNPPGTATGSLTNADLFFHTDPYEEPIYETRLECGIFDWLQADCAATPGERAAVEATGIVVMLHREGTVETLSSCSGTLIGDDLFLTGAHCLDLPDGDDVASASVTFDFQTACSGSKPSPHAPRFYKVRGVLARGAWDSAATDWLILQLDRPPSFDGITARPIRATPAMAGEQIVAVHHPNGAAKKLQRTTSQSGGTTVNGLDYAGGSSGSTLFDANGEVVGGPLSSGGGCTVSYSDPDDVSDSLANPPAPPVPLDVMLVFDRSGSMGQATPPAGRLKIEEARDAAALFVRLTRTGQGDRLGLASFSGDATSPPERGLATITNGYKTQLVGPPGTTGGVVGGITPGGTTSIGDGLDVALSQFGGGNAPAVLLLTDGMQNTPKWISDVEPSLSDTKVVVVGFGDDSEIDSPLLDRLARDHNGRFTRAVDGMTLRKFFAAAFGDIFADGVLMDPAAVLPRGKDGVEPVPFHVCGEDEVTVVVGWASPNTPLTATVYTPDGVAVGGGGRGKQVVTEHGPTWWFQRIRLPYQNERDGTWTVEVRRASDVGTEFVEARIEVPYFVTVIPRGGPVMFPIRSSGPVYTGDDLRVLVGLRHRDGTAPEADVRVTIEAPIVSLGDITTQIGLVGPVADADPVDAYHATLQQARGNGTLVPSSTNTYQLYDDGLHGDGALERDGIHGDTLVGVTRCEGTYLLHARGRFGAECVGTRETVWSVAVEIGIDPDNTTVEVEDPRPDGDGGMVGTVRVTPRDRYGSPLGPGRGDRIDISGATGVELTGPVRDGSDGSYTIPVAWDPDRVDHPGVVIAQPGRPPVVACRDGRPTRRPERDHDCNRAARELLECLGMPEPHVATTKITKVSIDIDLDTDPC